MNDEPLLIYGQLIPIWKNFTEKERAYALKLSGFKTWMYWYPEPVNMEDITQPAKGKE